MNTRLTLIFIMLLAFFISCSTVQVSQDYASDYVFGNDQTFGWNDALQKANTSLVTENELLAKRFKESIELVFEHKGLSIGAQPDFLVSYTYTVTSRIQSDPVNTGFGFGYGRYGRHGGIGISTGSSIRQYDQGKLVINVHAAGTGQQIWKGTGTREIFTHTSPEEITTRVHEMVETILQQFPPTK